MTTPNFADAPLLLTDADVLLRIEQRLSPAGRRTPARVVRVAEGQPGPVVRLHDAAVLDAELVEPGTPAFQLGQVAALERQMVQPGAVLVETLARRRRRVGVQPEQLATVEGEDGVVEPAGFLVLVEHRLGTEQFAIPADAAVEVGHRDGDVGDLGESGHRWLP